MQLPFSTVSSMIDMSEYVIEDADDVFTPVQSEAKRSVRFAEDQHVFPDSISVRSM